MFPRAFAFFYLILSFACGSTPKGFTIVKDLRSEWMVFEDGSYQPLGDNSIARQNTIYFTLDPRAFAGSFLRLGSERTYYLFVNGKVGGAFKGETMVSIDSLIRLEFSHSYLIAIHQDRINRRDLTTAIVSTGQTSSASQPDVAVRPYWYFRDFVVVAGLIIILFFLVALRLNPKLTSDYLSLSKLFSSRESDDSQASARLTSSANVQFYILCSLLIGFYLHIVFHSLPLRFALSEHFQASGFWMISWQWMKLSGIIFFILLFKIFLVFSLTRLFGMRGMARYHFFNWIRLLLLVFGAATVVLFMYFIARGSSPDYFVIFLSVVVVALIVWIMLAFFKLRSRSGHSMFHLFSYLCGTEIIPLLITVKVLFQ